MKKLLLIGLAILNIFSTGCWDMIEINERVFPYALGMDLNKEENSEDKFKITFSYPNINALGKNPTQDDRVHVITTNANSAFEAIHRIGTRLQYPIDTKILKVLVLSEEVARDEDSIRQIVDGVNRDFILNKGIKMILVKGSAEDFIKSTIDAIRQDTVEGPIYSMLTNEQNSTSFPSLIVIDFIGDMDRINVAIVPLGIPREDELVVSGGAIFKNYTFIDYIDDMENRAIAILNNEVAKDGLHASYENNLISVLATSFKTKRKLIEAKENIIVSLSVEVEGQLHEYTLRADDELIETVDVIQGMEKALEDKLKLDLEEVIYTMQRVQKADVFKIGEYLRKFHPKLWKQVEKDWDKIFPDIKIEVEVDVQLRRRGLTK